MKDLADAGGPVETGIFLERVMRDVPRADVVVTESILLLERVLLCGEEEGRKILGQRGFGKGRHSGNVTKWWVEEEREMGGMKEKRKERRGIERNKRNKRKEK